MINHLLNKPAQQALLQAKNLGVAFERPLLRLAQVSEESIEVLNDFYRLCQPDPFLLNKMTFAAFLSTADNLEKLAKKSLPTEEFRVIQAEINQRRKIISARLTQSGTPMPEFARVRSVRSDASRIWQDMASAEYQAIVIRHLNELAAKTNRTPAESLAYETYQRISATVTAQSGEEGWKRVFDYCARNAPRMASAAQAVMDLEAQLAQAAAKSPGLEAQLRQAQRRLGGYLYPVRGDLGEIYLHYWRDWRDLRTGLRETAEAIVYRRLKGWQVMPFSGNVLIDGKKAWDEGILLLKPPKAGDTMPRAALFAAAQVKVAQQSTAILQTIKDRRREIGRGEQLPRVSIVLKGEPQVFLLEALPPDISVTRFIFNAQGGQISLEDVAKLRVEGLQVFPREFDITIEGIDALARQFISVAPKYLASSSALP